MWVMENGVGHLMRINLQSLSAFVYTATQKILHKIQTINF